MKRSEVAILILIVSGAGLVTYFVFNSLLSGLKVKPLDVDVATPISAEITDMDLLKKSVFVEGAYNPTIKVKIGDQANQQPFNASAQ
jgi:hypothetical protein